MHLGDSQSNQLVRYFSDHHMQTHISIYIFLLLFFLKQLKQRKVSLSSPGFPGKQGSSEDDETEHQSAVAAGKRREKKQKASSVW